MINVKDIPVDVEEVRLWTVGYRNLQDPPISWPQLSIETGIPAGTLQPFCKGTYQGNNENIARKLFQFRQSVDATTKRQETLPVDPGYFETETSRRIMYSLQLAHMGRITVIGTSPGTGKTISFREYRECNAPVFIATMKPSNESVTAMIEEVHAALGLEPRYMSKAAGSRVVMERLKNRRALLIIDEANHLGIESIEEIRGWHDETGVGICLAGNEELIASIETGRRRDRFARLNSRIADRHLQKLPLPEDVRAFCDAWGIVQPDIRQFLKKIALTPDAGGLRECKQLIEAGSMIAAADDRGLTLADMRDAQSERATRWIKA